MYYIFTSIQNKDITVKIKAKDEAEARMILYDTVVDETFFELTEVY